MFRGWWATPSASARLPPLLVTVTVSVVVAVVVLVVVVVRVLVLVVVLESFTGAAAGAAAAVGDDVVVAPMEGRSCSRAVSGGCRSSGCGRVQGRSAT